MYAFLFVLFFELYIISPFLSYTVNKISLLQYSKLSGIFPASSCFLKYSLILKVFLDEVKVQNNVMILLMTLKKKMDFGSITFWIYSSHLKDVIKIYDNV